MELDEQPIFNKGGYIMSMTNNTINIQINQILDKFEATQELRFKEYSSKREEYRKEMFQYIEEYIYE